MKRARGAKKKISSKGNKLMVEKYATTNWNKKTSIKTYSKTRPSNIRMFNYHDFDNVFDPASLKGMNSYKFHHILLCKIYFIPLQVSII